MRDMIGMMLSGQAPDTAAYQTVSVIPNQVDKSSYAECYFDRNAHGEKVMQLSMEIRKCLKTMHKMAQTKMMQVMEWKMTEIWKATLMILEVRQKLRYVSIGRQCLQVKRNGKNDASPIFALLSYSHIPDLR